MDTAHEEEHLLQAGSAPEDQGPRADLLDPLQSQAIAVLGTEIPVLCREQTRGFPVLAGHWASGKKNIKVQAP